MAQLTTPSPTGRQSNEKSADPYHHIEVKLDQLNANLSYRRGYYSSPRQTATAAQGTAALQGALQTGMPPATMLYVRASIQPPKANEKTSEDQLPYQPE